MELSDSGEVFFAVKIKQNRDWFCWGSVFFAFNNKESFNPTNFFFFFWNLGKKIIIKNGVFDLKLLL